MSWEKIKALLIEWPGASEVSHFYMGGALSLARTQHRYTQQICDGGHRKRQDNNLPIVTRPFLISFAPQTSQEPGYLASDMSNSCGYESVASWPKAELLHLQSPSGPNIFNLPTVVGHSLVCSWKINSQA